MNFHPPRPQYFSESDLKPVEEFIPSKKKLEILKVDWTPHPQYFSKNDLKPVEEFIPSKKKLEILKVDDGKESEKEKPEKKNNEYPDPCHGKPKEFFIIDVDPLDNTIVCREELLTFIAINYPDHYSNPFDIIMWL